MRTKNLGIVLGIVGLIMMIYTGFDFVTTKNVIDLGPIQIDKNEAHPVRWSPIIGAILLGTGIILTVTNKKKVA